MTVNYLFISGEADVEELPYPKLKSTILKLYRKEIIQILITLPFTHVGFFPFLSFFVWVDYHTHCCR